MNEKVEITKLIIEAIELVELLKFYHGKISHHFKDEKSITQKRLEKTLSEIEKMDKQAISIVKHKIDGIVKNGG